MSLLGWLLAGSITIGSSAILVREVVGNAFGVASAIGGMRRRVWAWPVGIVGNLVLFTGFVGGILDRPQVHDLWGQAGRQGWAQLALLAVLGTAVFYVVLRELGSWLRASRHNARAQDRPEEVAA